jgi:addiction module HigA family antidote
MASEKRNEFWPDYAVHPGETLLETIIVLGMRQTELARRMGRNKVELSRIIAGRAGITSETALQLERTLGVAASFWIALQCQFDEVAARKRECQRLVAETGWLKQIPFRKMVRLGWIADAPSQVERLRNVLDFFGIATAREWKTVWNPAGVQFRMSPAFKPDILALSAWLRQGERQAQAVQCAQYDGSSFLAVLQQTRRLTVEQPEVFLPRLIEICAGAGVAVVFVPELPGVRASGATRWVSPTKALLQLCLRHRKADHLWFTFFHEAGHILRHGKRETFIESNPWADEKEVEADRFASDFLVPSARYERFAAAAFFSKDSIVEFARSVGIAPGIVVGRLQHDGRLPHSHCNDLRVRLEWAQ